MWGLTKQNVPDCGSSDDDESAAQCGAANSRIEKITIKQIMKTNPKTPKILNILGLAVAIAAFMVVAMVRYYDLRYDKSYPGADPSIRCGS